MKIEVEFPAPHAKIIFARNRDSVCAGDDTEPHDDLIEANPSSDPAALARRLGAGYLPSVAGYGHWWECILNGAVIAKVFPNGTAEKAGDVKYERENTVYFKYHSATF